VRSRTIEALWKEQNERWHRPEKAAPMLSDQEPAKALR